MKKSILLVVVVAAISLVACTNGATEGTSDADSTAVAPIEMLETEVVETATVDTTAVDSTVVVAH